MNVAPHGACANCVGGHKYAICPSDATFMNALCIYNTTIFVRRRQHTEAHNEEQFVKIDSKMARILIKYN
jgi:hypothetical protein